MKWIKGIRKNSITFSITFLLILITGNGILDFLSRSVLKEHNGLLEDEVLLNETMDEVLNVLKNSDLGFRGFYIIPTQQLLNPYTETAARFPGFVAQGKQLMAKHSLKPERMDAVVTAYNGYFKLLDKMIEWRVQGNTALVDTAMVNDPGFPVWQVYNDLHAVLKAEMAALVAESKAKTDNVLFIATIVRISLFVLGIPTLLILLFRLRRESKKRMELFKELDENNRKYLFNPHNENESQQLEEIQIISSLITNLRKATDFISNIAKGNYSISWEGLNSENKEKNKGNLAGELLLMREQMLKVKEEDKIRLWATEGVSKFAELVRQNQDNIQVLSDKITSEVVKSLGANQASLFFVEERGKDDVVLELHGCYAYDRKKFMEKTVEPGQGIVGQAYLEKEITYLTNIPQNYLRITSGLGEANPGSLVVVPLKFNDHVEGILEIASFKTFKQHEFDFLNKIGEIIASAIITLRSSTEMKTLMEDLQSKSEEMKAQEEEMRQNMEELQATQEEMSRKAREYQNLIVAKDEVIAEKSKVIESLQSKPGKIGV